MLVEGQRSNYSSNTARRLVKSAGAVQEYPRRTEMPELVLLLELEDADDEVVAGSSAGTV
jgi:hypothetical protein